jgi:hypothetical protein
VSFCDSAYRKFTGIAMPLVWKSAVVPGRLVRRLAVHHHAFELERRLDGHALADRAAELPTILDVVDAVRETVVDVLVRVRADPEVGAQRPGARSGSGGDGKQGERQHRGQARKVIPHRETLLGAAGS